MMTIRKTMLGIGLGALLLCACDKGDTKTAEKGDAKTDEKGDDKTDEKTDEKADEKADEAEGHGNMHGNMHGGMHDGGAAAEVADVDAGARVEVSVDGTGYHPAEIKAPAKSKVTLAFKRTTDQGCGQKLVIADMELEKDLPLDEAVEIEVEVPETGELGFACGMNMYKGKVVPKS
jgi:hypothetical protein